MRALLVLMSALAVTLALSGLSVWAAAVALLMVM